MSDRTSYISPFSTRYSSKEMQYLFSGDHKFKTWRHLWIYLASCEKELGLNITDEQIAELEASKEDINYDVVKKDANCVDVYIDSLTFAGIITEIDVYVKVEVI